MGSNWKMELVAGFVLIYVCIYMYTGISVYLYKVV